MTDRKVPRYEPAPSPRPGGSGAAETGPREHLCEGYYARRRGLPADAHYGLPCRAPVRVERGGKWYCGKHDPERKASGAAALPARVKELEAALAAARAEADRLRAEVERVTDLWRGAEGDALTAKSEAASARASASQNADIINRLLHEKAAALESAASARAEVDAVKVDAAKALDAANVRRDRALEALREAQERIAELESQARPGR